MPITTVSLSSAGQVHYGTPPNNVGAFGGTLAYEPRSASNGVLNITIQNTTDPSVRGCIVGIGLAIPAGATVTLAGITYRECMFDVTVGTIDCMDSVTGYGNAGITLSIQGLTWNCPGVIPHGPRAGLRSFQTATITLSLSGTALLGLTASDWHGALTSGTHSAFCPVHFRWINENNIQDYGIQGDDYVSSG